MVRYGHSFFVQKGKREQAKAAYIAALKRHPDDDTAIRSGLYYLAGKNYAKMGPVLLVLGGMHCLNVYIFSRVRKSGLLDRLMPPVTPDGTIGTTASR